MAFDLKAFYKELGFTDEEASAVSAVLDKPERIAILEKNQLRQSDYSKAMNTLKGDQAKLADAQKRLDAEAAEWASLSASEKAASTELRDKLNASEQRVLALQQRVTKIATDTGLDVQKALEGIDQAPPKEPAKEQPVIDTSKLVGVEQFGSMSEYLFNLSVELPMLAQEHFELTGERLDTRALKAEIAKRATTKGANLDPRAIWEETYQIPQKREAKATAAIDQRIKDAEARGYERARSEAALPVPPSQGHRSPLLRTPDGQPRQSKLQRPQPENGVAAAAQALATGKYRQSSGTPATQ